MSIEVQTYQQCSHSFNSDTGETFSRLSTLYIIYSIYFNIHTLQYDCVEIQIVPSLVSHELQPKQIFCDKVLPCPVVFVTFIYTDR